MKFYGPVGFVERVEKRPGVYVNVPSERFYSGDVLRRSLQYRAGESVHDELSPSQQLSLVADPYARNHVGSMKYVKWMGTAWKITGVEAQPPRLILSLGGAYNGATVGSSDPGA